MSTPPDRDRGASTGSANRAAVEIWIDAGGTFTDCVLARPDGTLRTCKLLSSGVVRGRVAADSSAACIRDAARRGDPPGFFAGWTLALSDRGDATVAMRVARSDAALGALHLDAPLPARPIPGAAYELRCDLPAPLIGARWLLGLRPDQELAGVSLRLGTTRGTNALLERRGARTALLTTAGLRDLLRIGDQTRPRLFDLHIRKPAALFECVVEVHERLDAGGRVLCSLDADALRSELQRLRANGIESLAVCLLHAHANPIHELRVAALARACGFAHVSLSSSLAPLPGAVARGETTVVDAYLAPLLQEYLQEVQTGLGAGALWVMGSSGALTPADRFRPRDSVLSGPAGGAIGVASAAASAGLERVIGVDIGGTSTDVCRCAGPLERRGELRIDTPEGGGLRIVAAVLAIETVAAGGGSICAFDGAKPIVGPRSAGADPGPACYGRGGPLCLTDVNLLLGRIDAARFPIPLSRDASAARLAELIEEIARATGVRYAPLQLAEGLAAIADAHVAGAVQRASLQRGHDPRDHALAAFGGAGGQHACALAEALGMRTVLLPANASVLSAVGIGAALRARHVVRGLRVVLDDAAPDSLAATFAGLQAEAQVLLEADGVAAANCAAPRRTLELRYRGQDETLAVAEPPDGDWRGAFERAHRARYGFDFGAREVEVFAARVELAEARQRPPIAARSVGVAPPPPTSTQRVFWRDAWVEASRYDRAALPAGATFRGPALVTDPGTTVWVAPDWAVTTLADGALRLDRAAPEPADAVAHAAPRAESWAAADRADPLLLELFHQRFTAIATQMGAMLQRTALSTNVKDRLDFSCALYDSAGGLVAHAPHIPVHLGALGHCVRCLIEDFGTQLRPDDVWVTNDPDRGGSHLPDVTVITPVFDAAGERVEFFLANRAHHAEIGGITPGSMPPHSRCLAEEGVLIRTRRLVARDGASAAAVFPEAALRALLSGGPYPSRQVEQNLADLRAQVAANHCGAGLLTGLVVERGAAVVQRYMRYIQQTSETKLRTVLAGRPGHWSAVDALDDGTPIAVTIDIDERGGARFDFAGSGPVHPRNFNACPSIVAGAVIYCLRCLIAEEVPLNAGLLAPVEIRIPPGILAPPACDDPALRAAVVAGNVETSQRLVDVILAALGLAAASQGTMNNLAFGDTSFGYYETIGGGAGAGPDFDGAGGVHVHMTNTRLTDAEILETRFPVRVRQFEIRGGSGGLGRRRGGDGIIRELEFLAPLQVSLLTERRERPPFGLHGGSPGAAGENWLIRAGEPAIRLPGCVQIEVRPGNRLRIETPGGGGFGTTLE